MTQKRAEEFLERLFRLLKAGMERFNTLPPTGVLFAGIVLMFVSLAVYHWWNVSLHTPQEIDFLSAPDGAKGSQLAERLSNSIEQPSVWPFRESRFRLKTIPTGGYEDNRKRVHEDRTGLRIGFAHDGFEATENVQVLLPLEYTYFHVVVSKQLYDEACQPKVNPPNVLDVNTANSLRIRVSRADTSPEGQSSGAGARFFRDVVPLLKSPNSALTSRKVFLGASLSGTRQLADIVLKHYGIDAASVAFGKELNWNDTVAALIDEEIHMAFFLTEPGLPLIYDLAKTGRFYLLGFDDAHGIAATRPYIHPVSLPPCTYGHPANTEGRDCFCRGETWTLATRRVIVASKAMTEQTAFSVARQLSRAYEAAAKPISWRLPAKSGDQVDGSLYYVVHAGAKYLEQGQLPSWHNAIPTSVKMSGGFVMFLLLCYMLNALLNYATQLVAPLPKATDPNGTKPPDVQPPETQPPNPRQGLGSDGTAHNGKPIPPDESASPDDDSGGLAGGPIPRQQSPSDRMLHELLERIEEHIGQVGPEHLKRYRSIYRQLSRRCVEEAKRYQLSEEQQEELRQALSKLDWEIESCSWRPQSKSGQSKAIT
jgi:hypothetical protein